VEAIPDCISLDLSSHTLWTTGQELSLWYPHPSRFSCFETPARNLRDICLRRVNSGASKHRNSITTRACPHARCPVAPVRFGYMPPRSGPISRKTGFELAHSGIAYGHRVRNRQPDGGFSGDGTSPVRSIRLRVP